MIQTKTLKEALKDPGVIEVVEELIGTVTEGKAGLMDNISFKTMNCKIHNLLPKGSIFKILSVKGLYTYGNFFCFFGVNESINYSLLRVRVSGETSTSMTMESICGGSRNYEHVEFFYQVKNNQLDVFAHIKTNSITLYLQPIDNVTAASTNIITPYELSSVDIQELKRIEIQNY